MKTIVIRMLLISGCILFYLAPMCWAVDQTDTNPPIAADPLDSDEQKRIEKKIADAMAEAVRTGKTSIDVYLDEIDDQVQATDLTRVSYVAIMENGQALSGDERVVQQVIAGEKTKIPGLGDAIVGLKLHQKKQVILSPKEAFGEYKKNNSQGFTAVRTLPVFMNTTKETYLEKFKTLPEVGQPVAINPYFKSQVTRITGEKVVIKNLARDGYVEQGPFGKTKISVANETIRIFLDAEVGAPFMVGNKRGIITSADKEKFMVDFNHPFSGQKLIFDLEILSITKASRFKKMNIEWIDDHDKGFDQALASKKGKVLILYADWCQWCEKLFSQTMKDPRIKQFKDDFVWVKANSDKDQSLKSFYGQNGFPMIVLTDYQGKVLKKMEGFKDAPTLLDELSSILNPKVAKADKK